MTRRLNNVQWLSVSLIVIVLASFVSFLFGYLDPLAFWIILGIIAFLAYKKIPGWSRDQDS